MSSWTLNHIYPGRSLNVHCTKNDDICCINQYPYDTHIAICFLVAFKENVIRCKDREIVDGFENKALESWVLENLEIKK